MRKKQDKIRIHFNALIGKFLSFVLLSRTKGFKRNRLFAVNMSGFDMQTDELRKIYATVTIEDLVKLHSAIGKVLESKGNYYATRRQYQHRAIKNLKKDLRRADLAVNEMKKELIPKLGENEK